MNKLIKPIDTSIYGKWLDWRKCKKKLYYKFFKVKWKTVNIRRFI